MAHRVPPTSPATHTPAEPGWLLPRCHHFPQKAEEVGWFFFFLCPRLENPVGDLHLTPKGAHCGVQPLRHRLVPGRPEAAGTDPSPAVRRCKCMEIRQKRCRHPCPGEISPGRSWPSPDFRHVNHAGAMVNMPQALLEEAAAASPGSDQPVSPPPA